MPSKVFRVTGSYRTIHHEQPFSKEVVAKDPATAREYVLSLFGSKHGVPRRLMKLGKVDEVPFEKIEDAVVRHEAEMKR